MAHAERIYDPQPDEGDAPDPIDEATSGKRSKARGMTEHGFRVGSDSAQIVDILVAGGLDRQDINEKVADAIGTQTKSGRTKNIPSLISGLLSRLEDRGYHIESSWKVIPPVPSKKGRKPKK
jgi:hypothetical protein